VLGFCGRISAREGELLQRFQRPGAAPKARFFFIAPKSDQRHDAANNKKCGEQTFEPLLFSFKKRQKRKGRKYLRSPLSRRQFSSHNAKLYFSASHFSVMIFFKPA
jgi:hypothetical protein